MTALLPIAQAAYEARCHRAARMRDAGSWSQDQADDDVAPWAKMVCLLGGTLPAVQAAIARFEFMHYTPGPHGRPGDWRPCTPAEAHESVAAAICSWPCLREVLATARDKAVARAERSREPNHIEAARQLMRLADHFGCRPLAIEPRAERPETPEAERIAA